MFYLFVTELWPSIDVRILFLLDIFRTWPFYKMKSAAAVVRFFDNSFFSCLFVRSGPKFYWSRSGSKLFAKGISRGQKSPVNGMPGSITHYRSGLGSHPPTTRFDDSITLLLHIMCKFGKLVQFKSNLLHFNHLTFCLPMSTAENHCKQFEPRLAPTKDLMVVLKEFFIKVNP